LSSYFRLPIVHACGGSWVATRELIANREFDRIAELAAEAVAIVKQVRKDGVS
jgi:2-dehydro-3-deoxyphosphogluconate aldolase/(4S)-4-hydroxy-2-oxoglutarate aldolase